MTQRRMDLNFSFKQVVIKEVFHKRINNTHLNCWLCLEERRDKNNEPQKERNTTTKTIMNLVMSCLIILAKVFVYNPVVLQIQEYIDQKKKFV